MPVFVGQGACRNVFIGILGIKRCFSVYNGGGEIVTVIWRFGRRRRVWNGGGRFGTVVDSLETWLRVRNGGAAFGTAVQTFGHWRRVWNVGGESSAPFLTLYF